MNQRLITVALLCAASLASAQTVNPVLQPHVAFTDGNGFPCANCKLYSYAAGTTTPLATYKDSSLTANTNPVVLDAAGGAVIWVGAQSYKFVLKDALGATVWTVDNVAITNTVTLPHAQLPTLVSSDIPDNAANTTGTSGGLSGIPSVTVGAIAGSSLSVNGSTPITSVSSANSQAVVCPAGGTGTQYCSASGTWLNGGSGGGLAYTSPTLNFIPAVSDPTGTGTVINSGLSDDGANTFSARPFYMNATFFLNPTNTATNVSNYQSLPMQEYISYWNGSAPVTASSSRYLWVGAGTTPQVIEDNYYPAGLTNISVLYAQDPSNVATVGGSVNTPKFILRGATLNGSAVSQLDNWNLQGTCLTGNSPACTLNITHNGSSGSAIVSMPAATFTGGTPGIQLTAAAFATYPGCSGPNEGLEEAVTDSATATWGATVTGGSTNHIKMYCDGTAWTVEAK